MKLKFNNSALNEDVQVEILNKADFSLDLAMTLNICYLAFDLESEHDLLNVTSNERQLQMNRI